ncbi:lutropin-choriogonadotropic hormone receptor-like [Corticium candelabrum]|uniref:lutropin-choriogonadotropic hormone receptor-like n=1 Tax=Corticium candelabrum TaxID=121492 RepID=UPI002E2645C7|nr:lutropin-choriogonadotropic hormone receptor-like [Corticium candelabrum]
MVKNKDLKDNEISHIEDFTFVDACKLTRLFLHHNPLSTIEKFGLAGTRIELLDVTETSLASLPKYGVENLEELRAAGVRTLKSIPSKSHLPYLRKLSVFYQSQCCAYRDATYLTRFGFLPTCGPTEPSEVDAYDVIKKQRSETAQQSGHCTEDPPCEIPVKRGYFPRCLDSDNGQVLLGHFIPPCSDFENSSATPPLVLLPTLDGMQTTTNLTATYPSALKTVCYPPPNDFNSCEDVMGNWLLRILVWLVVVVNICGNLTVVSVFLVNRKRFNAVKLILCNMAFADLCMSVYLITLAIVDAKTYGEYVDYAIEWKTNGGCEAIGFVSVFSSILSLYSLTALTMERFYTIHFAMYGRKLGLKQAGVILAIGWVYALIMATLPLVGVSDYTLTAICLPFDLENGGRAYIIFGLSVHLLAFCIIACVYVFIFCSITDHVTLTGKGDSTVLFKMSLLVAVDFCCWMPIIVTGIISAATDEVSVSLLAAKYMMVFIYPLNSCANPFLYAIFTKPFKRDFFEFWYRFGYFEDQYFKYLRPTSVRHSTQRRTIHSQMSRSSMSTNISLVAIAPNGTNAEASVASPDCGASTSLNVTDAANGGFDVGRSVVERKKSVNFEDRASEGNEVERVAERQEVVVDVDFGKRTSVEPLVDALDR